jgi:spoIIIJ-associated protein
MPRWLEFEDKSVEKAVSKACAELNIKKEKLKHDVISYGSSGIFGLVGTKKARIRVEVPDVEKDAPPKAAEAPQPEHIAENDVEEETTLPLPVAESPPLSEIIENSIDIGRAVLERIVDGITTGASISIEEKPDRILFDIQGGTAGVLIGKRGQNLEAIHYLVEKVVNKNAGSRVRIQVDVEGYLETRRNSLKRLAERLAQKSKKTGKPMTIGQMNAHDRRIIHLALKDDNSVRTQSMGDGYYRKLVIFPKKHASQRRK